MSGAAPRKLVRVEAMTDTKESEISAQPAVRSWGFVFELPGAAVARPDQPGYDTAERQEPPPAAEVQEGRTR
jgi:hypothetical protein